MPTPPDDLQSDPLLQTAPFCEGFRVLEPAVLYARIGAGGMGAVYRGRHFSLECDVAVKVLKPDLAHDENFVARFAREARLAARISNENVVRVLDVKEKNGIHYLVMEFVRGETARERVKRKGPLKEAEALAILMGATLGLREAHSQGIVHRDIKPDNVLVSAEGAIKLADLGLAKAKSGSSDQSLTMLQSGVMGTPQYMPPEQWRSPDVSPTADVWALGATLWFMLAGKSAIPAGELLVVAERIRDHDFPSIATVRQDVRPEVQALIAKCTARDPNARFADARELAKALRPLVDADDDLLRDPAAGSANKSAGTVTPPPRATLARIRLQVEQDPSDATQEVSGPLRGSEDATIPQPSSKAGATDATGASRATGAGVGAATATAPGTMGPATGVAPPPMRRVWITIGALLLVAAIGSAGYAAGWFGPRKDDVVRNDRDERTVPPPLPDRTDPVPSPVVVPKVDPKADPKDAAREALARGLEALPVADKLDAAIAQLELALQYDPSLDEARTNLVLALLRKGKQLETTDPDGAYDAIARAGQVRPGEASVPPALARISGVLRERLVAGAAVRLPAPDAALRDRMVRVEGQLSATKVRTLRIALDGRADAASQPFPRERSVTAPVVAGEFEASVRATADGAFVLRVEAEDTRGIGAELAPRKLTIDSVPPEVVITAPAAGAVLGADIDIAAVVTDSSAVTVKAGGAVATRGDGDAWTARTKLPDGEQQLVVEATDAGGLVGSAKVGVRIDATPPVVDVSSSPAAVNQPELVLTGKVTDASAVTLTADGAAVEIGDSGAFTVRRQLDGEREHTIELVAKDALANAATKTVRVRLDATAPVLTLTTPAGGEVAAGDVAISGGVADAGVCDVQVNGAAATVTGDRWRATIAVAAGADVEIVVTARDGAGNEAERVTRKLRGLSSAPVPEWAAAAPDAQPVVVGDTAYPNVVVEKTSGMRMRLIPPAPDGFQMGSPTGEADRGDDERQHRRVIRAAYWLGETEVTQAQWQAVMGDNPSVGARAEANPVDNVSWNDCQAFVQRLNAGGGKFRLPSEAEWEYACRAGTETPYSFGATVGSDSVNFNGTRPYGGGPKGAHRKAVVAAGSLPANAFGLREMHGNLHEWVEDKYAQYPGSGTEEPTRGEGTRIVRGGHWNSIGAGCRSAARFTGYYPYTKNANTGMRLARSL